MKKPIGVWFSAVLVIFVLSVWTGLEVGAITAQHWYREHPLETGSLSKTEQVRMQTLFFELQAAEFLRLYANISWDDKKVEAKYLGEISNLERLDRRSNIEEIRPILVFDLGLAHIDAAMVEEQNDEKDLAKQHMESAKKLFESLGWQDCSDETLAAAQSAINTSGILVCRKRLVNDPSSKDRISIGGIDRVVWRRFPRILEHQSLA